MSKSQHAVFQILNDKKPSSHETIQKKEGALRGALLFQYSMPILGLVSQMRHPYPVLFSEL